MNSGYMGSFIEKNESDEWQSCRFDVEILLNFMVELLALDMQDDDVVVSIASTAIASNSDGVPVCMLRSRNLTKHSKRSMVQLCVSFIPYSCKLDDCVVRSYNPWLFNE